MKLIVAHQILIASAIGLAAIFAIRGISRYALGRAEPIELVLSAVAVLVGAALGVYLRSIRAKWAREGGRSHHST
jgi:peptidoglycan biosynthesis protein MviN/MurJ (putative lipid II flippase)